MAGNGTVIQRAFAPSSFLAPLDVRGTGPVTSNRTGAGNRGPPVTIGCMVMAGAIDRVIVGAGGEASFPT